MYLKEEHSASNVAPAPDNMSINGIYQEVFVPSLGRQIFKTIKSKSGVGYVYGITMNDDESGIAVKRELMEVYEDLPVKMTSITSEAIHDIWTQFGEDGLKDIARYLRGFANRQENEKTLEFLANNSASLGTLWLSAYQNAETVFFELAEKINQGILFMNSDYVRSYTAYAVVPWKWASSLMSLDGYLMKIESPEDEAIRPFELRIGKTGFVTWYVNPDPEEENTVYVGLTDPQNIGRHCAVFADYQNELVEAIEYHSGTSYYRILNRFGIAKSALHTEEHPMMIKFDVIADSKYPGDPSLNPENYYMAVEGDIDDFLDDGVLNLSAPGSGELGDKANPFAFAVESDIDNILAGS